MHTVKSINTLQIAESRQSATNNRYIKYLHEKCGLEAQQEKERKCNEAKNKLKEQGFYGNENGWDNPQDALIAATIAAGMMTGQNNWEYGSYVYKGTDGMYKFSDPIKSTGRTSGKFAYDNLPSGYTELVGVAHGHNVGFSNSGWSTQQGYINASNRFSPADVNTAYHYQNVSPNFEVYLMSADGNIRNFNRHMVGADNAQNRRTSHNGLSAPNAPDSSLIEQLLSNCD